MSSKLVEETAADRRLVFEYAVEEAVERAVNSFLAKTEGRARELRRLEAAAAAARLHRAGDNPAAWWPSVVPYAPPMATAGELERMDATLERDLIQFHTDMETIRVMKQDRYSICNRDVRVASRAPGVTDAVDRRAIVRGGLSSIERVKHDHDYMNRYLQVFNAVDAYIDAKRSITSLDQKPRLMWVETEIGTPAAQPEKEAERSRMNAQVAGRASADQPPGYMP